MFSAIVFIWLAILESIIPNAEVIAELTPSMPFTIPKANPCIKPCPAIMPFA